MRQRRDKSGNTAQSKGNGNKNRNGDKNGRNKNGNRDDDQDDIKFLTSPDFRVEAGDERTDGDEKQSMWMTLAKIGVFLSILCSSCGYYVMRLSPRSAGLFPILNVGNTWGFSGIDIPDLEGMKFVVTGGSAGLGKATTKALLARGAKVFIGCRNLAKCERTIVDIRNNKIKRGEAIPILLDLESLKSVSSFANAVLSDTSKLDGIILNAGFMANDFQQTIDGIESTFAVNHVSHVYLVKLLLETLKKSELKTIVSVTSGAHTSALKSKEGVPLTIEQVNNATDFDAARAYGASKLANILFVKQLDNLYYQTLGIIATAPNPGAVNTDFLPRIFENGKNLVSAAEPMYRFLLTVKDFLYWSPSIACYSIVGAALKPLGHGEYTVPIHRVFEPSLQARNMTTAKRLWDFTEKLINERVFN